MVRLRGRADGAHRGKLSGDPAVTTAAVALLHGYSDPLALLGLDPDDYRIAVSVVQAAAQQRKEYDEAMADYVAVQTARATVPGIAKSIRQLVRALTPRR